jgi:RNA polymerase sigma-70 factor, ECF subfamily
MSVRYVSRGGAIAARLNEGLTIATCHGWGFSGETGIVCNILASFAFLIGGGVAGVGVASREGHLHPAGRPMMIDRYCAQTEPGTPVTTHSGEDRDVRYREFVRLLAEHERRLAAYVHALIPLWQDAEDVLQNTKLRLWEQFDSFRPGSDFAAWAITVATYMVRAHRTCCQRDRVCFSDRLLEKISQSIPPASHSTGNDRLSALLECVKGLNGASRRLLRLVCVGHRRIKDIAHDLGRTPTATRVALFRVRRTLFECIRARLQERKES